MRDSSPHSEPRSFSFVGEEQMGPSEPGNMQEHEPWREHDFEGDMNPGLNSTVRVNPYSIKMNSKGTLF
eukprot:1368385-Prorocentrum_lima.AAC.1